jgi:hypothetical protein
VRGGGSGGECSLCAGGLQDGRVEPRGSSTIIAGSDNHHTTTTTTLLLFSVCNDRSDRSTGQKLTSLTHGAVQQVQEAGMDLTFAKVATVLTVGVT